ncbi:MAG: bifunctional nuclease domain-containing protein [Chitinophagales bacterium]|jgi:bifunctional DNase/RNase|nr:bifunctional nuclease family protein [Bacteroidota bacterium]MBP8248573.1 bifunctional nuclease family protein [Chitinophagales bacterium]MBK9507264.1 bifunctional nuclease family protein [Bacteroidota bacterium]MBK9554902.1 bifunctional nuclease family protein [Bacteroidota bacterium]MBL0281495.1 bifunctional nuclease family protein [Bacteroidota bacterium]
MQKIELEISGLSHTITQSQSYAVLLSEVGGMRKLPIVIGAFEAQAIAVAIEKVVINRPLSHDLIKNLFTIFNISLKEVLIDNLQDGIFYSKLICEKDGQEIEVDSRTSDALALAVRFNCPIYTFEFILETAGAIINEQDKKDEDDDDDDEEVDDDTAEIVGAALSADADDIALMSLKELNDKLKEYLDKEDYESAARIRDEIEQRKNK